MTGDRVWELCQGSAEETLMQVDPR
jgi:hypothetical protein